MKSLPRLLPTATPRFCIERLTRPGDVVYYLFMGRGPHPLKPRCWAASSAGNDINPLSLTFTRPRLRPPTLDQIAERLHQIKLTGHDDFPKDLLIFYHADTLQKICALRKYFLHRRSEGPLDSGDDWLCLVSLNRLTGHSSRFFSAIRCRRTGRFP